MDSDKYYTPQWAIDAIMAEVRWNVVETFLEPCAGDGRIADAVARTGQPVMITQHEIDDGEDYLSFERQDLRYTLCVTNPPFSKWIEFAERANFECWSIIMLGRLSMLGTQKRRPFWNKHPLSHLWALSKRPSFDGPGAEDNRASGTDNSEYAWFGWSADFVAVRPPGIYHL